jgi:ABC-type dipeptide/oligopeptide/nickel transport system permease component
MRFHGNLNASVLFLSIVGSLLSVPHCGLYFALRCKTFIRALMWTAGVAILLLPSIWYVFTGNLWMHARTGRGPIGAIAMQLHDVLQVAWWAVLLLVIAYHAMIAWWFRGQSIALLERRELGNWRV